MLILHTLCRHQAMSQSSAWHQLLGFLPKLRVKCGVQGGKAVSQRSARGPDFGATRAGAAAGEDLGRKQP